MINKLAIIYVALFIVLELQMCVQVESELSTEQAYRIFAKYLSAVKTSLAKRKDPNLKKAVMTSLTMLAKKIEQVRIQNEMKSSSYYWNLREG